MNRKPVYIEKPLTPDEFFKLFGKMLKECYVLGSMGGALSDLRREWAELKVKLGLRAYSTAEECEQAARTIFKIEFDHKNAFDNLIEAAENAALVWSSDSASVDPEEVHAMLVDAVTAAKRSRGDKANV